MKPKSGQAAIEFLITYGWAIMAALIAIGALYYFGVFHSTVLDVCMINEPGFLCKGYKIDGNGVTLNIQNTLPLTIENVVVSITPYDCVESDPPEDLKSGESANFVVACSDIDASTKFSGNIVIRYNKEGSGFEETATGSIKSGGSGTGDDGEGSDECDDNDGDGYEDETCGGIDCNDADEFVNPGIQEVCENTKDDDCVGGDATCPICSEGQITQRCDCGGSVYETGYCCSDVYAQNPCSPPHCEGLPDEEYCFSFSDQTTCDVQCGCSWAGKFLEECHARIDCSLCTTEPDCNIIIGCTWIS